MFKKIKIYFYYTFISQLVISILSLVLVKIGFNLILKFSNEKNIDLNNIFKILLKPKSLIMVIFFILIIAFLIFIEFVFLINLIDSKTINIKSIIIKTVKKMKNVLGLQFCFLLLHIFLLIPFGINISILKNIYIPDFIINELMKTNIGYIAYFIFMAFVIYINIRLMFVIPLMILNDKSLKYNIKESLNLTKKNKIKIISKILSLEFILFIISFITYKAIYYIFSIFANNIFLVSMFLTITQLLLFIFTMISKILIISILLDNIHDKKYSSNKLDIELNKGLFIFFIIILIYVFNCLFLYFTTLNENIIIIAHRGYTKNACENTLSSIINASKANANFAEIDIQMTKDGKFIVMHDLNLKRLAGINKNVKDMNYDEISDIIISQNGYKDKIPTLKEAIDVSKKYNIGLLIEIKVNGLENEKYYDSLYNIMKENDVLHYPVMSINKEIITTFEKKYPMINTGYVIPIQFGDFSNKNNDFYVIEDFSYKPFLAYNNSVFVWTINDEDKITKYLYSDVKGIITDEVELVHNKLKSYKKNNTYFDRAIRLTSW